ncbi:uncharacterized protein LOC117896051 [Drosophila subobscura]|uniref:uncharacterized protein LOC117896051 n=1 Tax=Drosophila subobscura TaxID=7241 RepID=UPI00155AF051|nr:uncharacterized protein LOC117896051 [Drosophila subobscura]
MEPDRKRKRLYPCLGKHMPKLSSSSPSPSSSPVPVASQDSEIIISSESPPRETPEEMAVSTEASDDPRPTTSAVAADVRNWVNGPSRDDFTSSDMSLNAVNGCFCLERLVHGCGRDLTPQACDKFLHEVLPIVNTYQLPTKVKKRLRLLDLHPCFRRIEQEYQYVPNAELSTCFVLKANRDFRLALPTSNDSAQASHTVLINDAAIEQKVSVGYNFKISPETASLFSAMLSNDMELSIGQRHDLAEIHRLLRQAKQSFEDPARVLPFRRSIHYVVYNMDIFVNLRSKICKAINRSYH